MTVRRTLVWLTTFLAVSTIAGGVAILLDWIGLDDADLEDSPFSSYVVPGLALLVLVGGTATAASILLARRNPVTPFVAAAAGAAMMIFEIVQMLYIPFHVLQVFYLVVGALTLGLAVRFWQAGQRG